MAQKLTLAKFLLTMTENRQKNGLNAQSNFGGLHTFRTKYSAAKRGMICPSGKFRPFSIQ